MRSILKISVSYVLFLPDIDEHRLKFAKSLQSCDITHLLSTSTKDPAQLAEILRQIGKDDGCHASFECCGVDSSLKTAMHVSMHVSLIFQNKLSIIIFFLLIRLCSGGGGGLGGWTHPLLANVTLQLITLIGIQQNLSYSLYVYTPKYAGKCVIFCENCKNRPTLEGPPPDPPPSHLPACVFEKFKNNF